jgi:hypothetical protein
MRDGSSQTRLRYGAGRLMVRLRLEAMILVPCRVAAAKHHDLS